MSRSVLVVATGNAGKLREIRALLADLAVDLRGLGEAGAVDFPPEGDDYEKNAVAKARVAAQQLQLPALADDSGLEVAALDGAPGPHSARYGGAGLSDAARAGKLLAALDGVPAVERAARFVCVAALARPDGRVEVARGVCEGRIVRAPRGAEGFGYDPVFEVEEPDVPSGLTMAEVGEAVKNRVSHRARALEALGPKLASLAPE